MGIAKEVVESIRWLSIGKFSGQLFTWVITIIVIRLLSPIDYGLMASAGIFCGFLTLISELGFSASLIQTKVVNEDILRRVFGIVILVGIVFFLILFSSSTLIGEFFDNDRLIPIIKIISLQFLIIPFLTIPKSMIEKEMKFKEKSIIDFSASIVSGTTTLILAVMGYGVWSLVFGSISLIIIQAIGYNIISPFFRIPKFNFDGMASFVRFSGYVTLDRMVWYFYTQADVLIIGKILGQEILGYYALAMHLASLFINKLSPILSQVSFPAYSKIQLDLDLVSSYFIKSVRIISIIVFPIFFGLASVSNEFILIFVGDKWAQSILPFKLLCLVMPFRMLGVLCPSPLKGVGRADINLRNILITSIIMSSSFYILGNHYGMIGICYAWLTMYPICLFIMLWLSMPYINVRLINYIKTIVAPLSGGVVLYLIVTNINKIIDFTLSFNFVLLVLSGIIVYTTWIYYFSKERFYEILELFNI